MKGDRHLRGKGGQRPAFLLRLIEIIVGDDFHEVDPMKIREDASGEFRSPTETDSISAKDPVHQLPQPPQPPPQPPPQELPHELPQEEPQLEVEEPPAVARLNSVFTLEKV